MPHPAIWFCCAPARLMMQRRYRPMLHIFTRSKLPWLELPAGARAFEAFYKIDEVWSAESKERLRRNRAAQA